MFRMDRSALGRLFLRQPLPLTNGPQLQAKALLSAGDGLRDGGFLSVEIERIPFELPAEVPVFEASGVASPGPVEGG
jgi:hypothetical protein